MHELEAMAYQAITFNFLQRLFLVVTLGSVHAQSTLPVLNSETNLPATQIVVIIRVTK